MDFNDNQDTMPIPEVPEAQEPISGVYQGAGVGKKESPYANSPYYSYYETQHTAPDPEPQPEPRVYHSDFVNEAPKKPQKHRKKTGRRILSAVLTVALVAGSCGITAMLVNDRWEARTAAMEQSFRSQLAELEQKINQMAISGSGSGVSGSPVSNDGLNPAQVYAGNVDSVVGITSIVKTSGSMWGNQSYASTGSGFIISADGYIITNYHVVEGGTTLTVTTHMGEEYPATMVGGDEINDVALLKVEATGLNPVEIGSSDALIVGDMVVAIGNPLGELTATQTVGYVSAKDRSVTTDGSIINMIQTDAAINSGNSGGPLFNMKGQVVGITSAKYSGQSSSGATIEGIGFAIPIDDVMSMIEDFKNYGYLKNQAYLGVVVLSTDSTTASMYSLPNGSYVESVEPGGSADRAGVKVKDIIIAVGEYTVDGNSALTNALRKFSAGDTTTITVYRGGQEIVLDITFDEKPADLDSDSTGATEPGEAPQNGSYEDWFNYYFGG